MRLAGVQATVLGAAAAAAAGVTVLPQQWLGRASVESFLTLKFVQKFPTRGSASIEA